MSANTNWPRWIFASVSKHFSDTVDNVFNENPGKVNPKLYVEGDERITQNLEQYFEFRMDGPYMRELCKDYWLIKIQLNVLVSAKAESTDMHVVQKLIGLITTAFTNGITIYKYGDGEDDNQSVLDCLQLYQEGNQEEILVTYLGQLGPDLKDTQASVEGYYRMFLSTSPETGV